MNALSKVHACMLVAALSGAAQAQGTAAASQRIEFNQATLNAFLNVLERNRSRFLYSGPPAPCTIETRCDVKLKPQELFDADGKLVACAMQVGEIQIDVGQRPEGKKTEIHWTIDPPAAHKPPTNAVYTFETHGLIVFKDDDDATLKKADSVTDAELVMTHKFKRHGGVVVYYPLVFQKIGTDEPALCGSADPKIINN